MVDFLNLIFLNKMTVLKRIYQCVKISSDMNFVEVGGVFFIGRGLTMVLLYGYINKKQFGKELVMYQEHFS